MALLISALDASASVPFASATPPSPALASALESLREAIARGDRAAFLDVLEGDARAGAQGIADRYLSSAWRPLTEVRVELVRLARGDELVRLARGDASWDGVILVSARAPVPAESMPGEGEREGRGVLEVPEGFARPEPGSVVGSLRFVARESDGAVRLTLREDLPAFTRHADLDVRVDLEREVVASTSRLALAEHGAPVGIDGAPAGVDGAPTGVDAAATFLLSLPAGAAVRWTPGVEPRCTVQPIAATFAQRGHGAVRLDCPSGLPRENGDTVVSLDAVAPIAPGDLAVSGGEDAFVSLHQAGVVPFAVGCHFTFELVTDVPRPLRSLSIGRPVELEAQEGRRRDRWRPADPTRAVDYLPIGAAAWRVESLEREGATLELWRTRRVGGPVEPILESLRDLVETHAAILGPLPHRAFRLVELPTKSSLAVSLPSLVFMTPDLLATTRLRASILSHEVGHQWFGNAVSPHPSARWASEGLAEHVQDRFVEQRDGEQAWSDRLRAHRDAVLGALGASSRPLATHPGGRDAYTRGALFAQALREELGDELFDRVMRAWHEELRDLQPVTADYQEVAEAVAGRSLGAVFDPWLRTTALPVLDLDWRTAPGDPGRVTITLTQDAPAFPLDVPVRILGEDHARHDVVLRLDGASATDEVEVPFDPPVTPSDVVLDPDGLLPLVRPEERARYLSAEAAASLAVGRSARARRLLEALESVEAVSLAPHDAVRLFAARMLDADDEADTGTAKAAKAAAREALDAELGVAASADEAAAAMLAAADALAAAGGHEAARAIFEELDAAVDDGSAVPRRLGLSLRALGREREARAALERALERRPSDAAARAALGSPADPVRTQGLASGIAQSLSLGAPREEVARRLASSSAERLIASALPGGRAAILVGDARTLLVGSVGSLEAVERFHPSAGVDLAIVEREGAASWIVVLEALRLRSRLSVLGFEPSGRATLVARHERLPAAARALAVADGEIVVAFDAARWGDGQGWTWRRFAPALGVPSEGPDDDDGLLRVRLDDDRRLVEVATSPAPPESLAGGVGAFLTGHGLVTARDDGGTVAAGEVVAWEPLDAGGRAISVRSGGGRLALVVSRDASRSPFPEDAQVERRLVVLDPAMPGADGVRELALPADVLDASLASDGTLVLEHALPSRCGAVEETELTPRVHVGRLPPSVKE